MCSEETSNEHPAKVMTFMVVFASVFCGWPCLLHCMAGFAKTGRGKVWAEKRIATSRRGRNADLHCRLCFDGCRGGGGHIVWFVWRIVLFGSPVDCLCISSCPGLFKKPMAWLPDIACNLGIKVTKTFLYAYLREKIKILQ